MNEETLTSKKFSSQNWIGIGILVVVIAVIAFYLGGRGGDGNKESLASPPTTSYSSPATTSSTSGVIDYTEASSHVGQYTSVRGQIVKVVTSKGTTFLDYCTNYKSCPFTAVVFSSSAGNFPNLFSYEGHYITIQGKIQLYQGRPEIILNGANQVVQVE